MASDTRHFIRINPAKIDGMHTSLCDVVCRALNEVPGVQAVTSDQPPRLCIEVNGVVIGMLDHYDGWETAVPSEDGKIVDHVREFKPRIIFKSQFRRGAEYLPGTVSGCFVCPVHEFERPHDLHTRPRPIDVSARMRSGLYGAATELLPWMAARDEIVDAAKRLECEGLEVRYGRQPFEDYLAELYDTEVGFSWRGYGMLNFRMLEYIRSGVVMITQPLGAEWPLREDITLEDGVHCVFCDDPRRFSSDAKLLLRDKAKRSRIRNAILDLWEHKLALPALGRWYWEKLQQASGDALLSR